MALKSWIPAIIFFIVMSLLYMFAKKVYKIVHRILLILFVINIIFVILIYADAREIQTSLPIENKTFFLADSQSHELLAGFQLSKEKSEFLSELDSLSYAANDLDKLQGNNYKIIIFEKTKLGNFSEIKFGNTTINQKESLSILSSKNALLDLTNLYGSKIGFDNANNNNDKNNNNGNNNESQKLQLKNINNDNQAKAIIFSAIATDMINKNGLMNLLRENKIQIHPETITFKFIKHLPESILKFIVTENEVKVLGTN